MTSYTVTQRTPLFQAANMASPRLGIAEAGVDIEGAVGDWRLRQDPHRFGGDRRRFHLHPCPG